MTDAPELVLTRSELAAAAKVVADNRAKELANQPYTARDEQVVYVFEATDGRVKVGITTNLTARRKAIEGASGLKIRVVTVLRLRDLERVLHAYLSPYSSSGEWFTGSVLTALALLGIKEDKKPNRYFNALKDMA